MRVFYFSEMAYHPAWGGGAKARLVARRAAQRQLRPADRPSLAEPLSRRVRAVRRGRARHHGQRAPQHRDLPDDLGADGAGDHRPRDQARAPPVARHADRQPPRPGARRRGDGVARRIVGRAARNGARQGCRLRDRTRQQQPGQSDAPLLGGARSDPEGAVDDRRPVQLGGRVLPLPQRQRLAAAIAAADPAGVDDRDQRRDRADGGRARACRRHVAVGGGRGAVVRGLSPARAGIGLDRRPRPPCLCRGDRGRRNPRGGAASRQPCRRLRAHLAGRARTLYRTRPATIRSVPMSRC